MYNPRPTAYPQLYKGIRADTIEDPVLRGLKAEELTIKREQDFEVSLGLGACNAL